jgi:hypothetical protein
MSLLYNHFRPPHQELGSGMERALSTEKNDCLAPFLTGNGKKIEPMVASGVPVEPQMFLWLLHNRRGVRS